MGIVILKTEIKREKEKIYYCDTDENGNIVVCEAKRGRTKKSV